ncbi:MAG: phosphoenolpyruvate carboxykinase (GTP), partial [Thermoleophilia bacterium]|nr:phosphoenolpyruvate carboxykinase (GTP) [Thermoleophilia bacterium]
AVETPIGAMPTPEALDLSGIDVPAEDLKTLLTVDVEAWKAEAENLSAYYDGFGERLPAALRDQLRALRDRLDGR